MIFLGILATWEHTFMQNGHTHTQQKTGVMTLGKICKADMPKDTSWQLSTIIIEL